MTYSEVCIDGCGDLCYVKRFIDLDPFIENHKNKFPNHRTYHCYFEGFEKYL